MRGSRRTKSIALLVLALAVAGLTAGCGGSDDDDGGEETQTTTTEAGQSSESSEIPFPELAEIRDCLVDDEGFPEPLVGKKPPNDDNAADAELVFNAGNNQPVFVIYYESAERARRLAPNVEREAKRLRGEYVLEDNIGVLYIRTPADVRERIEGCVRS